MQFMVSRRLVRLGGVDPPVVVVVVSVTSL